MQKSMQEIATTVAESMKNLTQSFVPILEVKDKENQKLKRLLKERANLTNDDEILMTEFKSSGQTTSFARPNEQLGGPYKRQNTGPEPKQFKIPFSSEPKPFKVPFKQSQNSEIDLEAARIEPTDDFALGIKHTPKKKPLSGDESSGSGKPNDQTAEGSKLQGLDDLPPAPE